MSPRDTHKWERQRENRFTCTECGATGRQIGSAWPPIRTADYILSDTCEQAKRIKTDRELRRLGIDPSEITQ